MGARLVVQFIRESYNSKTKKSSSFVIASAYYHWDAEASVALSKMNQITEYLSEYRKENHPTDLKTETKLAIDIFRKISNNAAKPSDDSALHLISSGIFKGDEIQTILEEAEKLDRNEGIIEVTTTGIERNYAFAEMIVNVYLSSMEVSVIECFEQDLDYEKGLRKVYKTPYRLFFNDFDFDAIPVEKFKEFYQELLNASIAAKKSKKYIEIYLNKETEKFTTILF